MANNDRRRSSLTLGERMMFLAGILFCLVLITTALMPGLFARYTASSTGRDSARVARFQVEGIGGGEVAVIRESGENGEYKITVSNLSEVTVSYDVDFVFPQAVGSWLKLQLGEISAEEEGENRFHFASVGELPPSGSAEHIIGFHVDNWKNSITETMTGLLDKKELTFTVYIHAVQID